MDIKVLEKSISSLPQCSHGDVTPAYAEIHEKQHWCLPSVKQDLATVRDTASCCLEALLLEIDKLTKIVCQIEVHTELASHETNRGASVSDSSEFSDLPHSQERHAKLRGTVSKVRFLAASDDTAVRNSISMSGQAPFLVQLAKPQPKKQLRCQDLQEEWFQHGCSWGPNQYSSG